MSRRAAGRADGRPSPRRRAAAAVLVAGAVVFGPAVSWSGAAPASAAPAAPRAPGVADPDRPVQVTMTTLEPRTVTPGAVVELTGVLTNSGDEPISDLTVRLQRGTVITSRAALAAELAEPSDSNDVTAEFAEVPGVLEAGDSRPFRYTTTAEQLQLTADGVYPALVNVNGSLPDGDTQRVGELTTHLVVQPTAPTSRTAVSWLWPLTDRPHRDAEGEFTDDELSGEIADDGRLDRALATVERLADGVQAAAVPVTLAVDPALVEELSIMAAGDYTVTVDGERRTGAGTAAAEEFLARLSRVAADHPVLALPYADADLDALQAAGGAATVTRTLPGTDQGTARDPRPGSDGDPAAPAPGDPAPPSPEEPVTEEGGARAEEGAGAEILRSVLGVTPRTDVAWPLDGVVGGATLATLRAGGVDQLVLAETSYADAAGATGTEGDPAAARVVADTAGGELGTLVADSVIGAVVADLGVTPGGGRAAEQRYLAELAALTSQQARNAVPALQTVLVVPPRSVDVDPAAAAALMADTAWEPWLQAASLTDLAAGPVADAGALVLRTDAPGPGAAAVADAVAVREDFATAVVGDADAALAAYDAGIARATTAELRDDPAAASAAAESARDALVALRSRVGLLEPANGTYTLATSDAPLVLTVSNELPVPVRVRLDVAARGNVGLTTSDIGVQEVDPGSRLLLQVPSRVTQSGGFAVTATLLTPGGGPLGEPVQMQVKSTAYGTVTLVITIGAAALLGLLFLRRLVLFVLARRRPPEPEPLPVPADGPGLQPPTRSPV